MKTFQRLLITLLLSLFGSNFATANFRTVVIDAGHGGRDSGGHGAEFMKNTLLWIPPTGLKQS